MILCWLCKCRAIDNLGLCGEKADFSWQNDEWANLLIVVATKKDKKQINLLSQVMCMKIVHWRGSKGKGRMV